jgi:serine/threonine protein kinase
VLDLGLARVTDESGKPDELTSSGSIMGTADFMAPEQAVNTRRADHRADVYSLGCTLYYLLTGQVMYAGETAMEKLLAHREQPIPPLRALRPEVPAWLEVVYHCMVAKEPDGRYPSMNNVILALNRGAVPAARGRRRRWVAAAALVCVALGGTILAALLASSPRADNGPTRVAVEPTPIKKSNGAQQVAETIRQLKARNPRYSGEEKHTLDDQGRVRSLWLLTDEITDLSPVTALTDLRRLQLQGGGWNKGKVVDLKPLRGMQLADLSLNSNPVKDLTPLAGIPLVSLSLPNTNVSDLRPLAKMKLEFLDASHQPNITDLTPLTGMPLTKLFLWRTKVQDIGPLRGMPLRELNVAETQVRDLEPLRDCRQLVDLRCNFDPKRDEPFLRPLPKLQHINGMRVADLWKPD